MSWTASRNGKRVDLSGPVGDTLRVYIAKDDSADPDANWTGWSWLGQVRQSATSAVVATFSFADTSTTSQLDIVATIADTSAWTPRDTMVYAIEGSKGSERYTAAEGLIVPTDNIAYS